MRKFLTGTLAVFGLMVATAASAGTPKLTPADPQPSGLKPGLNVAYGYAPEGEHIKTLADARHYLKRAERGRPLTGLGYPDTNEGEPTLTSKRAENVAAHIWGFIRFDKPGTYDIDFLTNDGLHMEIGGQTVGHFDGRQSCDAIIGTQVEVPRAGWYRLDGIYFNRLHTSCLNMRWAPAGQRLNWVPDSVFGRK